MFRPSVALDFLALDVSLQNSQNTLCFPARTDNSHHPYLLMQAINLLLARIVHLRGPWQGHY